MADLTAAYGGSAERVWRGLTLPQRRHLLIQDEMEANQPVEMWWFMHTRARVELEPDGRIAHLRQGQAGLEARLVSPSNASFQVMEAGPLPSSPHPPKQADNPGVRKLSVHLQPAQEARLAILLTPYRPGQAVPRLDLDLQPLEKW